MSLIPQLIVRAPEDCQVLYSFREADKRLPDGTIAPGDEATFSQSAGTGWRWLGRVWLWKPWP